MIFDYGNSGYVTYSHELDYKDGRKLKFKLKYPLKLYDIAEKAPLR